jgi:hypothetical protein
MKLFILLLSLAILGAVGMQTAAAFDFASIDSMSVHAVPIPAAIWLFGSAILGFAAIRRNSK